MNLILLIDEDQRSLEELKTALEGRRFRLIATPVTRKGLEFARAGLPDLVVFDSGKSEKDTLRHIETLRKDEFTKDISVIVTLKMPSRDFVLAAQKLGVQDFIVKPYDPSRLLFKIENLLAAKTSSSTSKKELDKESGGIRTVVIGDRVFLFLKEEVTSEFVSRFEGHLNTTVRKDQKTMILDLRATPELNEGALEHFQTLLGFVSDRRIIIVAGRNYGPLLQAELNHKIQLFISAEEMNEYFQILEKSS